MPPDIKDLFDQGIPVPLGVYASLEVTLYNLEQNRKRLEELKRRKED